MHSATNSEDNHILDTELKIPHSLCSTWAKLITIIQRAVRLEVQIAKGRKDGALGIMFY